MVLEDEVVVCAAVVSSLTWILLGQRFACSDNGLSLAKGLSHVSRALSQELRCFQPSHSGVLYSVPDGMVSHWLSSHFVGYSPRNSFSNLKQHLLPVLGLEALLGSPTCGGAI